MPERTVWLGVCAVATPDLLRLPLGFAFCTLAGLVPAAAIAGAAVIGIVLALLVRKMDLIP